LENILREIDGAPLDKMAFWSEVENELFQDREAGRFAGLSA
jgi:hypothetical protein